MVLVFADQADGQLKKSTYEALAYGAALAKNAGTTAEAIAIGNITDDALAAAGNWGITKVHHLTADESAEADAQAYAKAVAELATAIGADIIVFTNHTIGKAVAPRLSVRLKAGLVAGAIALPDTANGFVVKKSVFSGKAFEYVRINTPVKIITLNQNAFRAIPTDAKAEVVKSSITLDAPRVKVVATQKVTGEVPLNEAERVVSGGRGLKGPENWNLVTELAEALDAATACSRPVADSHWRPHHEHVGQTGGSIAPNLYFAIGISGAIQHLAGVNRSKTIVVINKDPEAPFFKAADYGIVGDVFEVVPKITQAVKLLKGKE
jgi:electron transfer flavoprotein alpha subunit